MKNHYLGLDTETEKGRAVLVCAGKSALPWPEKFARTMRFLADVLREARAPGFVAFNMDFDVQALLRLDVSPEALKELGLTRRARIRGWRVEFVPGKYFRAQRGRRVVRIFDQWPFFQCSLDTAAKKTLGKGKLVLPPQIEAAKNSGRMARALRKWPVEVTEYCLTDALRVEELAATLGESVEALGMKWRNPKSPASLARQYWGSRLAGRFDGEDETFARRAFFGGRIEVIGRGRFHGLKRYDLHSAYPSAMVDMVAPGDCDRIEGEPVRRDAAYAIVRARVRFARGAVSYPLPVELPGAGLCYPWGDFLTTTDLHSWRAIEELRRLVDVRVKVLRVVQWVARDNAARPFAKMRELYARRKVDPKASLAIKLVMNSTYGLMAERVTEWGEPDSIKGLRWIAGRWTQRRTFRGTGSSYVLAAHVTGAVRARVWRETLDATPVAFMTDGVLCKGRPSGPIGDGLGEWGEEGEGGALIVGSGLYAVETDEGWKTKSRGWSRLGGLPDVLRSAGMSSFLHVSDLRARSLAEMTLDDRPRWAAFNDLRELPRTLDLCFDHKRQWPGRLRAREFLRRAQYSRPLGVVQ